MISKEERSYLLGCGTTEIDDAIAEAVALAIEDHRRAGNPIATWRDGKVVWIPAEEIPPYAPPVEPPPGER